MPTRLIMIYLRVLSVTRNVSHESKKQTFSSRAPEAAHGAWLTAISVEETGLNKHALPWYKENSIRPESFDKLRSALSEGPGGTT